MNDAAQAKMAKVVQYFKTRLPQVVKQTAIREPEVKVGAVTS